MKHGTIIATATALTLAGLAGCGPGGGAGAERFPTKTVTVICPWAAGGGTDRVSRFFASEMEARLGSPVVVVNRTGGSGAVGHGVGSAAAADGHTVTMGTFELSTMHWMGISPLTWKDFEPVAQVNSDAAAIVVQAGARWENLESWLKEVRDRPGELKMSGTATGGAWDLARAGFLLAAGLPVDSVIWVPTDGSAPSLVELLGGHIDAVCCSLPEALAQIEAGQLRALTVMGAERIPEFPEVPAAREAGVDWEAVGWRGFLLPKGTPEPVVQRIRSLIVEIAESERYREFMRESGFGVTLRAGEEFGRFLEEQDQQWEDVIRKAGYARGS